MTRAALVKTKRERANERFPACTFIVDAFVENL
jgi:hypothetical protein